MSELNRGVEGTLGALGLRSEGARSAAFGLLALLGAVNVVSGCGHYGVDLEGEVVDAAANTSAETDKPTKPVKPNPNETTHADASTSSGTGWDKTKGETHTPPSAGDGGETESSEATGTAGTDAISIMSHASETTGDAALDDAAVDGSVGGDASTDAATTLDSGSNTASSGERTLDPRDAGTPICDPSCSCAEGVDCALVCLGEELCLANCETNASCDVVVGIAPTVKIDCASGALCSALDMAAAVVDVTCSGEGDCHAECAGEQSCAVDCAGPGKCVTKCKGDATCDVTCNEGSDCYVVYDNVDNVTLSCEVGTVNHCDGIVTCDLPCP